MKSAALVGLVALALASEGAPPPTTEEGGKPPPRPSNPARIPPAPLDHDLLEIRNIFRYADEAGARPDSSTRPREGVVDAAPEGALAPPRARLVGLVDGSGGLVAALSIDGEVLLLGEGASARGFTVLGISEEAVHLRGPEGEEETLRLP